MSGMMARSVNFSAVNCDPSLMKTAIVSWGRAYRARHARALDLHTQTRSEQRHIQVGHELLGFGIEHALLGSDIARETDAHDLQHRLEDEQDEVQERGMLG